jgi:hypothetical protein
MAEEKEKHAEMTDEPEVEVDVDSDEEIDDAPEVPKDPRIAKLKAWGLTISAIGGLVTGLGGITGSLSGWFRQPQDNRPVKEAYEVLVEQVEKLNYGIQQNHEDILALSNWLDGYVSFADRSYAPKPIGTSLPAVPVVRRPARPAPMPTASPKHGGSGPGEDVDSDGIADMQDTLPLPPPPPEAEPPSPDEFSW